jgi:serine/threonine protein phosphatase 1
LKWSLGLDTACVFGGQLTACIFPEKRLVSVKARQRYWG